MGDKVMGRPETASSWSLDGPGFWMINHADNGSQDQIVAFIRGFPCVAMYRLLRQASAKFAQTDLEDLRL
jgi:hypothetical protein